MAEPKSTPKIIVAKYRADPTADLDVKLGPRYLFRMPEEEAIKRGLPADDLGIIERPRILDADSLAIGTDAVSLDDQVASLVRMADIDPAEEDLVSFEREPGDEADAAPDIFADDIDQFFR